MKKPSWKDVCFEFATTGLSGVAALNASRPVLREAMRQLQERGQDFSKLEDWCQETHGFGLNNRGTRAPRAGERRAYRSQKMRERGSPFVKIPLNALGVADAGVSVEVVFSDDKIVIERPGA
jgi:hypothetical protein